MKLCVTIQHSIVVNIAKKSVFSNIWFEKYIIKIEIRHKSCCNNIKLDTTTNWKKIISLYMQLDNFMFMFKQCVMKNQRLSILFVIRDDVDVRNIRDFFFITCSCYNVICDFLYLHTFVGKQNYLKVSIKRFIFLVLEYFGANSFDQ